MNAQNQKKTSALLDNETTSKDKNLILSQYLNGPWKDFEIEMIERIENPLPGNSGWKVTHI